MRWMAGMFARTTVGVGLIGVALCATWAESAGKAARLSLRGGSGDPGTHWRAVDEQDGGYVQSGECGYAGDGNAVTIDGDAGRSATCGGERAKLDHYARADVLQSLRRQAGRDG